ncbi:MAG: hypothetical protein KBG15_17240 [Kofleriaceae bacterium]|nr:hypothetical protein [Kofleriaceae bacterium]
MSSNASSSARSAELSLQAQPFADDLIDVAAVNADVSDVLAARIEAVAGTAAGPTAKVPLTRAYAVLGAAGGGKTHLFARLRHRSGRRPSLVLLRPYFGLGISPRDVLAATIDQLCAGTQLTALTAHWVGDGAGLSATERARQVEQGVLRIVERLPHAEPAAHIITALFTVAGRVGAERWAELAWLSGREPRSVADRMLNEGDVLVLLRVLACIAAPIAPLVIVFDQLENLAGDSDTRVLAYGNVIAELVDTVPGLTIVQLAVTHEWTQNIAPRLSLAQRSRVANDLMVIHAPSRGQREALLRAWHSSLYGGAGPAFPLPLAAPRLETLLSDVEITPRQLLAELLDASNGIQRAEVRALEAVGASVPVRPGAGATAPGNGAASVSAVAPGAPTPATGSGAMTGNPVAAGAGTAPMPAPIARANRMNSPPAPSIAHVWQYETERIADELARRTNEQLPCDDIQLAEAISAALSFVDGISSATRQERSHVIIDVRAADPRAANNPLLPCTLLFITGLHHSSVVAALNKGIELAKHGRVVLVREARFPLADTWALVHERRAEFDRLTNTDWLWLAPADVLQSVALAELFSQARGKRVRLSDGSTPLPMDAVVDGLRPLLKPVTWSMVVRIVGEPLVLPAVAVSVAAAAATAVPQSRSFQAPPLAPAASTGWIRQARSLGVAAAKDAWRKLRRG